MGIGNGIGNAILWNDNKGNTSPVIFDNVMLCHGSIGPSFYNLETNTFDDIIQNAETKYRVCSNWNGYTVGSKVWATVNSNAVKEYNLTFDPPTMVYDGVYYFLNTPLPSPGTGAIEYINSTTLVTSTTTGSPYGFYAIEEIAFGGGVVGLNPTTDTIKFTLPGGTVAGPGAREEGNGLMVTTQGKLLVLTLKNTGTFGPPGQIFTTKLRQYDYATNVLETTIDLSSTFPSGDDDYGLKLVTFEGDIYILARETSANASGVYKLDLNTRSLIYTGNDTGRGFITGAFSPLQNNTVSLSPVPGEAVFQNAAIMQTNNDVQIYNQVSNTFTTIAQPNDQLYSVTSNWNGYDTDVAKKVWGSAGSITIKEYDFTFNPPTLTFNRNIVLSTASPSEMGAIAYIDDNTIIATARVGATPPNNFNIVEVDISGATPVETTRFTFPNDDIINGIMYTTSGKLIIMATALLTQTPDTYRVVLYQYDYATSALEGTIDISNQFTNNPETGGAGLSTFEGNIYVFARESSCNLVSQISGVYKLDLDTNTLVYTGRNTGFGCTTGVGSARQNNTVDII